jgi:hypothetical protein
MGSDAGGAGGETAATGPDFNLAAGGGTGGYRHIGGFGGGPIQRGNATTSATYSAGVWGGGIPISNSGTGTLRDADHGGGAGGQAVTTVLRFGGGNSYWGGGGGQMMDLDDAIPTTLFPGASVIGGDGGAYQADGNAPGGGGGGAPAASKPGDGARGEARIYVVRGSIPPTDFVFEV